MSSKMGLQQVFELVCPPFTYFSINALHVSGSVCCVCILCVFVCVWCAYQRDPKQLFETFIFQAHGSKLTMQSIKKCVDQGTWALLISRSNADKFADSDQGLQPHMSWDEFWPQVLCVEDVLCWALITICEILVTGPEVVSCVQGSDPSVYHYIQKSVHAWYTAFTHTHTHTHTHTEHTTNRRNPFWKRESRTICERWLRMKFSLNSRIGVEGWCIFDHKWTTWRYKRTHKIIHQHTHTHTTQLRQCKI